jgi:hypothetical protein
MSIIMIKQGQQSDHQGLGAGSCPDGPAYKILSDGTAIMATRVTTKEKANFDGSKWGDLKNREELTALLNNPSL